jgi:hypothetical protein
MQLTLTPLPPAPLLPSAPLLPLAPLKPTLAVSPGAGARPPPARRPLALPSLPRPALESPSSRSHSPAASPSPCRPSLNNLPDTGGLVDDSWMNFEWKKLIYLQRRFGGWRLGGAWRQAPASARAATTAACRPFPASRATHPLPISPPRLLPPHPRPQAVVHAVSRPRPQRACPRPWRSAPRAAPCKALCHRRSPLPSPFGRLP